ncbi:MAG: GGDEF domain-containing protein [Xanthobacteraceae bacterium]|nr:GGDEF domain-containing protein [Xanthobacteraceae bacterium]MBX3533128.1 GGDEF domain-containing protein [Xanthobacteraceae bacterium]MBX3547555.1 GGDEF domain-containing protein [Xanthobacteraceae bacterium]MCW5677324.1 GGDEF domain-containing protein [Xanthobacteraceae bacterium]
MILDVPTLLVVSIFVTAVLGLLLIFAWIQDRSIQALGWWGAAYLVGGLSAGMLSLQQFIESPMLIDFASALLFVACGMSWNGARLFDGKAVQPLAMFAGAIIWLMACQIPGFSDSSIGRIVVSSLIISNYTLFTAFELWSGRGEKLNSRWPAVIVITLHGVVFPSQVPLTMVLPGDRIAATLTNGWIATLAIESLLYSIAAAFILLEMAKERTERVHKEAALIDPLTGVHNRRAITEFAKQILAREVRPTKPMAIFMFDIDKFKSINDRFGHPVGDKVIRLLASTAKNTLRQTDVFGRLGGEEFAAFLGNTDEKGAVIVAERVRLAFLEAAKVVDGTEIGATVSIGVTFTTNYKDEVDTLLSRADEALYEAKNTGRNRVMIRSEQNVQVAAASIVPDLSVAAAEPVTAH